MGSPLPPIITPQHMPLPVVQNPQLLQQPYPVYPLPISQEKLPKALQLWNQYQLAKALEVPVKLNSTSLEELLTSSSGSTLSLSESSRDIVSNSTSSDVQEYGPESLTSFDGKFIKQRIRKRLSPVARAKAALARHFGSCWVCRSRRVKCPLEHFDIDFLEREYQIRLRSNNYEPDLGPILQTKAADVGIGSSVVNNGMYPIPDLMAADPYSIYSDSQMFGLGVFRNGRFCCQHLDGYCLEYFVEEEELVGHFETAHFPFVRIDQPGRLICLNCNARSDVPNDGSALSGLTDCQQCGAQSSVELWIYGSFVRLASSPERLFETLDVPQVESSSEFFTGDPRSFLQFTPAPAAPPPTDSGYQSSGFNQNLKLIGKGEDNDAETIMTDNRDLYLVQEVKYKLAAAFSKELSQNLESLLHRYAPTKIQQETLLEVLRDFSIRISHSAKHGLEERAASFVRQQRDRITQFFRIYTEAIYLGMEEVVTQAGPKIQDGLTLEEKMSLWASDSTGDTEQDPNDPNGNSTGSVDDDEEGENEEEEEEEEDYGMTNFPDARKFLIDSDAYQWLIARLQSELVLTSRKGTTIEDIRCDIFKGLENQHNKQNYRSTYEADFEMQWSPKDFVEEQFPQNRNQPLGAVIVLCGSEINAQALTCSEYMLQVWPKTGLGVLRAFETCLADSQLNSTNEYEITRGTKLRIYLESHLVRVVASGSQSSIAELGEQLAWMCAALRSAPTKDSIMYTVPRLTKPVGSNRTFKLDCVFNHLGCHQQDSSIINGSCWQKLFRNPVIVQGYPILSRIGKEVGLEISLEMMALLGNASRYTTFEDTLILKGFSTMFVPTASSKDSITWHFLFNEDDQIRIPYTEASRRCQIRETVDGVNASRLGSARHFLGWAVDVEQHTGTRSAKYDEIGWPVGGGCEFSGSGLALERMSFSIGKIGTVGASVARGIKDTPCYFSGSGTYRQEIRAARNIHVVLYDVADRRAWLVDGSSALLHLACTRLSLNPSSFFDAKDFKYADPSSEASAAEVALLDPSNRMLVLDEEIELSSVVTITTVEDPRSGATETSRKREEKHTITRTTFQQLVQELYYKLERLHDRQNGQQSSSSVQLRGTDREKLEGFAYMDLVDGPNTVLPRETYLEPSGAGWVALTKSIRAVTLLGKGFGEIIRPTTEPGNFCHHWSSVPEGLDYLAATVTTLREICRRQGDAKARPLKLANNVFWHSAGMMFEQCECKQKRIESPCERIQELYPPSLGKKRYLDPFSNTTGGILFGRSKKLSLTRMKECLSAKDREATSGTEESTSNAGDSGLGTSISSRSDIGRGETEEAIPDEPVSKNVKRPLERMTDIFPSWTSRKKPKPVLNEEAAMEEPPCLPSLNVEDVWMEWPDASDRWTTLPQDR
ncbi:hypothetical protein BKA61DRAFT_736846 [Leptodontidium sp. MPI-SDFR-AT-0119]|nr:hypothetical protein BKA61DRAFT_736846 [Leptodontidium sp. MPI-SDFR-AT-0119]